MKKILMVVFVAFLANSILACSPNDSAEVPEDNSSGNTGNTTEPDEPGENNSSMKLKIAIGSATFTATLQNNEAAKAFKAMLPMTVNMSEMNGNEKYYNLPRSLPTAASNPGIIQNGDLMLWGSSTLVVFYKTFSTSYSYTRIGRIYNPSGLQSALGSGNVTVTFELQ